MYIDTDKIVTMTAANQNFSAVARQTERDGKSVIFKNNRPKYILIDLDGGLSLADGSMGYDELLAWIREHVMPQEK